MDDHLVVRPATAVESDQPGPVTMSTFLTGCQGKLIGRVIVEQFEPADPSSDGICYKISFPAGGDDANAIRNYARDLVTRLSARLERG